MSLVIKSAVGRRIATNILFAILLAIFPLTCVTAVILFLVRSGLRIYKNLFRPDLGDFVTGISGFHSISSVYSKTEATSIISTHYVLEGRLKLEELQNLFHTKIAEFKKKRPSPYFPELGQYLTTWAGFAILKREKAFQISEHVKVLSDVLPEYGDMNIKLGVQDEEDENMAILAKLAQVPFTKKKSPWEFLVYHPVTNTNNNNNRDNNNHQGWIDQDDLGQKTVVFGRFHHALADGLSILTLLAHLCNAPSPFDSFAQKVGKQNLGSEKSSEMKKKSGLISNVFSMAFLPVFGLYDLAWTIMNGWDDNVWHRGSRWPILRTRYRYTKLATVSLDTMRRIRKIQGGPRVFNCVATAFTGSLRKYFIRHKLPVPEALHSADVIPIPKNTNRLTNNVTSSVFPCPTGLEDRRQILRVIERGSEASRKSRYPAIVVPLFNFIGMLPERLKPLGRGNFKICLTMTASNMPLFDEQVSICGKPCVKMHAIVSPPAATIGIYLMVSGYNGQLYVNLGVSEDFVGSLEDLKEIRSYFQEEMQALEQPGHYLIQ